MSLWPLFSLSLNLVGFLVILGSPRMCTYLPCCLGARAQKTKNNKAAGVGSGRALFEVPGLDPDRSVDRFPAAFQLTVPNRNKAQPGLALLYGNRVSEMENSPPSPRRSLSWAHFFSFGLTRTAFSCAFHLQLFLFLCLCFCGNR